MRSNWIALENIGCSTSGIWHHPLSDAVSRMERHKDGTVWGTVGKLVPLTT